MPRKLRPYAWLLGVVWGLPLLVTVVGYAILPKDVGPEQCEGIGFGCTLSPADTLVLLAAMSSVVLVPVGLLGDRRDRSGADAARPAPCFQRLDHE